MYASACSGIYKSEDAGEQVSEGAGNSFDGAADRVLMQDPQNLNTVFAGTTEGLYPDGRLRQDMGADDRAGSDCERRVRRSDRTRTACAAGDGPRRRAGEQ